MKPESIELVRTSFAHLNADPGLAGETLYKFLFEYDSHARALFRNDIPGQSARLMSMLGTLVESMEVQERIVPLIFELGRRHEAYGVRAIDYGPFGKALLAMLAERLGPEFTPAVREAWSEAFTFIADIMAEAQKPAGVTPYHRD